MYTPVNPSFTKYKWSLSVSKLYRYVLVMNSINPLSSNLVTIFFAQILNWATYPVFKLNVNLHHLAVFAWRIILNGNILFWLTISYQKPFLFSVPVFCSQIYALELSLRPKISLTYAISIVKRFFFFLILSKKIFLIVFAEFELLIFHNKIERAKFVENLPPSYLPYRFQHNLHSFLLWKMWKFD